MAIHNTTCGQLTNISLPRLAHINRRIDRAISKDNFESASNLLDEAKRGLEMATKGLWFPERINTSEIRRELNRQSHDLETMGFVEKIAGRLGYYDTEGNEWILPTVQEIYDYLMEDFDFRYLLCRKELQGFGKIIIIPAFNLEMLIDNLEARIGEKGGAPIKRDINWDRNFDELSYFGSIGEDGYFHGGINRKRIYEERDRLPFIFKGYYVSLVEFDEEFVSANSEDVEIGGRKKLKAGKKMVEYQEQLARLKESSMIPEEWIALYGERFVHHFINSGRRMGQFDSGQQHFDGEYMTAMPNCGFKSGLFVRMQYYAGISSIYLESTLPSQTGAKTGVRPVLRRMK